MITAAAIILLSVWTAEGTGVHANDIGRPRDCQDIISEGNIYEGHYVVYPNALNSDEAALIYCSQEDGMEDLPNEKATREVAKNCLDLQEIGIGSSGPNVIYPDLYHPTEPVLVYCDMDVDNGGWTVIQNRFEGTVDFYKSWTEYANGFGDISGEHYLGNNNIAALTGQSANELRIELEAWSNTKAYAHYQLFHMGHASLKYKLEIGLFGGDAGESLIIHNGQPFSTFDSDNDGNDENCAEKFHGAWWYNSGDQSTCFDSNLNGYYYPSADDHNSWDGITWEGFQGEDSLKSTKMMVRPNSYTAAHTEEFDKTLKANGN